MQYQPVTYSTAMPVHYHDRPGDEVVQDIHRKNLRSVRRQAVLNHGRWLRFEERDPVAEYHIPTQSYWVHTLVTFWVPVPNSSTQEVPRKPIKKLQHKKKYSLSKG